MRSTLRYNDRDIWPADPAFVDDFSRIGVDECEHGVALYGGILFPVLGHLLFESLSRLWPCLWLSHAGRWPMPVYFHHWPGLDMTEMRANPLYVQVFEALGIGFDAIRLIDKPVGFNKLIVANTASAYHMYLGVRMNDVFDRIVNSVVGEPAGAAANVQGRPTVFLSRSRWMENRRIQNESGLDDMMGGRRIRVVHTELMPPQELITMLAKAGTVISTDGSHAHLAVFCQPGTRIVMLDTRPVPTQFAIAALRLFRTLHVPLFETDMFDPARGITDFSLLDQAIGLALETL